jgi:hypothetical protein
MPDKKVGAPDRQRDEERETKERNRVETGLEGSSGYARTEYRKLRRKVIIESVRRDYGEEERRGREKRGKEETRRKRFR